MLLEQKKNILVAKIIGICNGIIDDTYPESVKQIIFDSLLAVKEERDYDEWMQKMVDLKAELLPNCLTCASPCGRTSDYSINDISDEDYRDVKIKQLEKLLKDFETKDILDTMRELCRISY